MYIDTVVAAVSIKDFHLSNIDYMMSDMDAYTSAVARHCVNLKYAFWNNKGGTGKTSLAFQAIARYAETHPDEKILAVDVCSDAAISGNAGKYMSMANGLMVESAPKMRMIKYGFLECDIN